MDVSNDNKVHAAHDTLDTDMDTRLDDFTRCCLCGTELTFRHSVDYATLSVREDAHCPSCSIRLRTRDHTLQ